MCLPVISSRAPGQPEVATGLPLIGNGFTLQNIEVLKSVTLLLHPFQAYSHFIHVRRKRSVHCNGKRPIYREWDRVYTFCTLLADLGQHDWAKKGFNLHGAGGVSLLKYFIFLVVILQHLSRSNQLTGKT